MLPINLATMISGVEALLAKESPFCVLTRNITRKLRIIRAVMKNSPRNFSRQDAIIKSSHFTIFLNLNVSYLCGVNMLAEVFMRDFFSSKHNGQY